MSQTRVLVAPRAAAGESGRRALAELIGAIASHAGRVVSVAGDAASPSRAVLVLPDAATVDALRTRYANHLLIEPDAELDPTY
jgi:hypothetical protein